MFLFSAVGCAPIILIVSLYYIRLSLPFTILYSTIMDYKISQVLLVLAVCTTASLAQNNYQVRRQTPAYNQPQQYYREPLVKQPPPRILSHTQSQNHDGAFKFEYAAENGLAQSEVIAPDGTRNGGYTYVDPHGKTITVKYTAGKDGFRIVQGDHIPRDSPSHQAVYQQAYSRPNYDANDDGQYKPEKYEQQGQQQSHQQQYRQQTQSPQSQPLYQYQQEQQQQYRQPQAVYAPAQRPQLQPQPQPRYLSNEIEDDKGTQYHDAPGKAYSFGTGYSFQFGG